MNRRTQGVWLAGSFAVAMVVVLAVGLARGLDHHLCRIDFSPSISCTFKWSSTSVTTRTTQSSSVTPSTTQSSWHRRFQSGYDDVTSWAVTTHASVAAPAQAASDDLEVELSEATGLPLPKRWVLTTAINSPFIKSIHVETPLDLAALLGFYRAELSKRRWTEHDSAVVEPDRAVIAFTTTDGPALLRLIHGGERTTADLSLRKPAEANAGILPRPGQVRLMLGNDTDEEAVITINEQTIELAARAGRDLTDAPDAGRKAPDSPEIDLPPGKYKVTLKVASSAAQNREFEVAADETWGLLVGPAGVPLPVHLY
jgi:hypothetical protein